MHTKIIKSTREDIIRERDAYDSDYKAKRTKRDAEYRSYKEAKYKVVRPVEGHVVAELNAFNLLQFDVQVVEHFSDYIEVRISCNENDTFDDNSALSWCYRAKVTKDGEVEKESNSWSGLKATTAAQIDSLIQTAEALKVINNIDWADLLNL